jgi:hypothetical protein
MVAFSSLQWAGINVTFMSYIVGLYISTFLLNLTEQRFYALFKVENVFTYFIIISLLMSPLLGHRPFLMDHTWGERAKRITHHAFYHNDLAMRNTADVTGGKPIAVWLQSISGGYAVNPLVAFMTSMEERDRWYSFVLSRTPHETKPHFLNK